MSDVTRLIEAAQKGDRRSAAELLPLVYEELRKLAAAKMVAEAPGHTLDATALVHEVYLRLVGDQQFDGRGHFFAAAAEAMRRILIENARRKQRQKHGGDLVRRSLNQLDVADPETTEELFALDEALQKLSALDAAAAQLVQLRYFAGMTIPQVAEMMHLSPRSADRLWAYARAFLHSEIYGEN